MKDVRRSASPALAEILETRSNARGRRWFLTLAGLVVLLTIAAPAVAQNPGDLVVVDFDAAAVIRVDPVTGTQTVVSSGGNFVGPAGIAVVPPCDCPTGPELALLLPALVWARARRRSPVGIYQSAAATGV